LQTILFLGQEIHFESTTFGLNLFLVPEQLLVIVIFSNSINMFDVLKCSLAYVQGGCVAHLHQLLAIEAGSQVLSSRCEPTFWLRKLPVVCG